MTLTTNFNAINIFLTIGKQKLERLSMMNLNPILISASKLS